MKISEIMDSEKLNQLIDDKYIRVQTHGILSIYNYAPRCMVEGLWTAETMQCRGLVTDGDEIIIRCMKKFLNLSQLETVPDEPYEILEKKDGSMIQLCHYKNDLLITTRGSFDNEYIDAARDILNNKNLTIPDNHSLICELIHPVSRIVLDYHGEQDLYLLAVINNETGTELPLSTEYGLPVVKSYSGDFRTIPIPDDKEGYVVKFKSGLRVKIKGDEYVRLHKIVTNINEKRVWESLMQGTEINLDNVPDEFYRFVTDTTMGFMNQYNEIEQNALGEWKRLSEITDRKQFAQSAVQSSYSSILFAMKDGKDYSKIIWKAIAP